MKKKFTLCAIFGLVILIIQVIYYIGQVVKNFDETVMWPYLINNIISILAWSLLLTFFIHLYKQQKY